MNKILKYNKICEFLNGISEYSVQHLGWATAIVAAILALTSIVFSQFNERSIQRANDIAREIRNKLNKDVKLIESHMIKEDFNHMTYLLVNSTIYKRTLLLFQISSYIIVFLWWFSMFGYINNAGTLADKVLIFLSTVLISIPFLYLPDILKSFNKNQPLTFNNKDELVIHELTRFLKENTAITERSIISDFLNPRVEVELVHRNINIHHVIDVNVVNFTTVFVIQKENQRITINVAKESNHIKKTFSVKLFNEDGIILDGGLFKLFKESAGSEATIFFCTSKTDYLSFKGEVRLEDGTVKIFIVNSANKTLIPSDYNKRNQVIVQPVLGEPMNYQLLDYNEK